MTKELMERVLDALITYRDFIDNAHIIDGQFHWLEGNEDAIKALEEELKQEQVEPETLNYTVGVECKRCGSHEKYDLEVDYPPPQPRKPLTDEQILHIVSTHIGEISPSYPLDNSDWINFAHAIESAYGIKE